MVIASLQELSKTLKSVCFHGKHPRTISSAYLEGVLDLLKTASQCLSGGVKVKVYSQKGNDYSGGLNLFTNEFDCFQENPKFSLSIFGLSLMRKVAGNCDLTEIFQKYLYSLHNPNGIVCFLLDIYAEPNRTLSIVDTISEYYLINRKNILSDKYSCCCVTGFGSIQLFSLFSSICEISRVQLRNESETTALPLSRVLSVLGNHCSSSKYLTCIYKNASGNYCRYDAHQTKSFAAVDEKFSLTSAVKMLCAYAPFDDSLNKRYKLLVSVDSVAQRANSLFLYRLSSGKKIEDIEDAVGKDQADATICIPTYDPPKDNLLKDCICKLAGYRHEFYEWIKSPNKCVLNDELKRTLLTVDEILYKEFSSVRANNSSFFKDLWKKYCKRLQYSTNLMDEDSFSFFIYTRSFYLDEEDYILFFPFFSNQDMFFEVVVTDNLISNLSINALHNTYSKYFTILANALRISIAQEKITLMAVKTAIGSIMSRNGSHNIGSHVLAALSHNVGTMPDDRVLYQYIQHRMDYIATATTEFPTWRQPVLFVSSVMKQFMMQKHLLNFISRSEGLSAYQFQNSALTATTQPNTIRIHIRRVHNDVVDWEGRGAYSKSEYDNFVSYRAEDPHSLEKDVYVAIPGGIVGQHAFYTILENILRNAAKHEWATAHNKKDHLDLYVDFRDNPVSGKVEFQIWNDRASKADSKDEGDNKEDITKIVEKLEARMTCRFVDPDGQLRKENWGLAEMRISAGFLIGSDISLIGGIGVDDKEMLSLIRPVAIKNCEGRYCLGYRFDLYKPKELLIVLPDEVTSGETPKFSEKTVEKLNALLAQYGINVISETKAKDSKGLAYSYALFDKFNGKIQGTYNLPFRVLYTTEKRGMTNEQEDACAIAKYKGSFKDVISGLEGLSAQGEGSAASAFAYGVLELVYSSWVKHVINQRCDITGPHALIVDMKDDGGGGKSLFSNANLLYFVFENSFNSAVRSYLAEHTTRTLNPYLAGALYAITQLSPRPQFTAKELRDDVDSDDEITNMILSQMVCWTDVAKKDDRVLKGYVAEGENGLLLPSKDEWPAAETWQKSFCVWNPQVGMDLLLNGLLGSDRAACAEMGDFIKYIGGTILEQARAYLAKYEERYSTLPRWFGMANGQYDEDEVVWRGQHGDEVFEQKVIFSSKDDVKSAYKKSAFCYWRHGDKDVQDVGKSDKKDGVVYLEPISGSQSYLNALKELSGNLKAIKKESKMLNRVENAQRNNAMRFVTELVENSVMRVLIIDERTRKFADEHPDVASIFASTGICVLGGEEDLVEKLFKAYEEKGHDATSSVFAEEKIGDITMGSFEIVIIHQGIIDKRLERMDKRFAVEDFYVWLKKNMRYVVITTGRGTPPNVPPDARVLPFSVVESTLFKRYPEKLLLVDTVMNMLPIGERSQS